MNIRPRFSVRTLAIFVTLVCVYFGAWKITIKYGVHAASDDLGNPFASSAAHPVVTEIDAPVPFIMRKYLVRGSGNKGKIEYHLWLFGLKAKLPFESEWDIGMYLG